MPGHVRRHRVELGVTTKTSVSYLAVLLSPPIAALPVHNPTPKVDTCLGVRLRLDQIGIFRSRHRRHPSQTTKTRLDRGPHRMIQFPRGAGWQNLVQCLHHVGGALVWYISEYVPPRACEFVLNSGSFPVGSCPGTFQFYCPNVVRSRNVCGQGLEIHVPPFYLPGIHPPRPLPTFLQPRGDSIAHTAEGLSGHPLSNHANQFGCLVEEQPRRGSGVKFCAVGVEDGRS